MPRGFAEYGALKDAFRCSDEQLKACFRSLKAMIEAHAAVKHMAMSVVALHVVARVVDYYITKYAAKPMEQLQNLVTQYALGLRRLELEDESEAGNGEHLAKQEKERVKARSRRVLLRLQHAANRSKWISSTECALYVHTEQQHWTSHNEVPMFLSRPLYLISECRRILSGSKKTLTRAAALPDCTVLDFARTQTGAAREGEPLGSAGGDEVIAPLGIPNLGNTCFLNALLQCCRQLLARIPSSFLPASQDCPLAKALQAQSFQAR